MFLFEVAQPVLIFELARQGLLGDISAPAAWAAVKVLGTAGYFAIALWLTWPTVLAPATTLISQWPTDADHALWIQWWFARAVETPGLPLFETDLLRFPDTVNLHLADLNLAINGLFYLFAKPLGLVAGYNAMLWLSFVASAGLMWALGTRMGGDALAGWLAGLVFAGSTYWISCACGAM